MEDEVYKGFRGKKLNCLSIVVERSEFFTFYRARFASTVERVRSGVVFVGDLLRILLPRINLGRSQSFSFIAELHDFERVKSKSECLLRGKKSAMTSRGGKLSRSVGGLWE